MCVLFDMNLRDVCMQIYKSTDKRKSWSKFHLSNV